MYCMYGGYGTNLVGTSVEQMPNLAPSSSDTKPRCKPLPEATKKISHLEASAKYRGNLGLVVLLIKVYIPLD